MSPFCLSLHADRIAVKTLFILIRAGDARLLLITCRISTVKVSLYFFGDYSQLAERMEGGKITDLELDRESLEKVRVWGGK